MNLRFTGQSARVLDFDCESRPLSYLGNDYTTAEVTAIAARFTDEPEDKTHVWVLGIQCQHPKRGGRRCETYHYGCSPVEMLEGFTALYDAADIVTGHYIRGYDLPLLNGQRLEHGLSPLSDKVTHDTKLDLRKRSKVSASQENLGATLGIRAPKVGMNTPKWREANRLTPEGLDLTRARVVGDVTQHIQLRQRLLDLGWLDAPRVWHSSGHLAGRYVP